MKSICAGIKPIMSKEMRFAIFCLENYKLYKNKEFYDVLYTLGYEYINREIDNTIKQLHN